MRRGRRFFVIGLLCLLIAPSAGCSAKSSTQTRPAPVQVESADVATDDAVAVAEQTGDGGQRSDNCSGVLDCTFFGLGAVLATPFWVLGAVLGLVF